MRPKSPSRPASRCKLESVSTAAVRLKTPVYTSQQVLQDEQARPVYEGWLQLPTAVQSTEDKLAEGKQQTYATEPTFDTSNIYPAGLSDEAKAALGPVVWRRVTGQLYLASRHHCRLVQSCVADHRWFLGALAAVSCRQELLLLLIVSDEQAAAGLYTFRFFKHGDWWPVLVDNRLPCLEGQQRLAFCSSGRPQELWPSLLEKAYARIHGGYPALASGSVADALVDLTGGMLAAKVNLSQEAQMAGAAAGVLWSQMVDWLAAGSIIVCMAKQHKYTSASEAPKSGIAPNSPYSVLSAKQLQSGTKLLQLHCPWSPEGMWQGAWAASSAEWHSDEGRTLLAYDDAAAASLEDPSVFWCSYWDFIQMFNRCWVLQLLPDSWQQLHIASGWLGATAGGPATPPPPAAANSDSAFFSLSGGMQPVSATRAAAAAAASPDAGLDSNLAGANNIVSRNHKENMQQQQRLLARIGVPVSINSSWCCNPQFRLTAAGTGQIVLCLCQKDPQVLNHGHLPKVQRTFQIGLLVLHDKAYAAAKLTSSVAAMTLSATRPPSPARLKRPNSPSVGSKHSAGGRSSPARPGTPAAAAAASQLGRVWVPQQCTVADSGLSSSREVVLRVRVEQGESYTLVPYARQAGDTGPFVLRVYSPHTMQLEQLPSPLSLVIGGQWSGHMAGGRSYHHNTWGSNPQYLISCQRESTAVIALLRPDVQNSLIAQPYDPRQCIGVTVCTPQSTAEGLGRRSAVLDAGGEVYAESDFTTMDEAVLLVQLQPEVPYLLVPSTAEPGIEAPYELRILSSQPIELVPLPEVQTICHQGQWDDHSAGGCNIHASWINNPAYLLRLQRRSVCKVSISRPTSVWGRNQPLGEMLGFYIIKQVPVKHKAVAAIKQQQLHESVFVPAATCEAELEVPGTIPLLIVPCTYAPHIKGSFTVTVTTSPSAGMTLDPIAGGLAAAVTPQNEPAGKGSSGGVSSSGGRPVTPPFPGQLVPQVSAAAAQ